MRLLLFSDLLLDAADGDTVMRRSALSRLCSLAARLNVDVVCCAGNLFGVPGATVATAEVVRSAFAGIQPIPVLVTPGSADWLGCGLYDRVEWPPNVRIFTEPRLTPHRLNQITIWGAAHVEPVHTSGFLDSFLGAGTNRDLALFFGAERTAFAQAAGPITAPFDANQARYFGLRHVLAGGLAEPRLAENYTYPGASRFGNAMVITVGEDGALDHTAYSLSDQQPAEPAWITEILDGEGIEAAEEYRGHTIFQRFMDDVWRPVRPDRKSVV